MAPLPSHTVSTPFAKIITFENGRQCVLYFDHLEQEPTLRMVMNSYGMNSSTKLNFHGQESREDKTKALYALLQVFDETKALEAMNTLDETLEKNLLPKFFPNARQDNEPFALFLKQDENQVLVIKDFRDNESRDQKDYLVREVYSHTTKEHVFKNQQARDEAFAHWEGVVLQPALKSFKP